LVLDLSGYGEWQSRKKERKKTGRQKKKKEIESF
jgi:hypothetical protein